MAANEKGNNSLPKDAAGNYYQMGFIMTELIHSPAPWSENDEGLIQDFNGDVVCLIPLGITTVPEYKEKCQAIKNLLLATPEAIAALEQCVEVLIPIWSGDPKNKSISVALDDAVKVLEFVRMGERLQASGA